MEEIPVAQWRGVDEGWGRRAVEFATLAEPANCREYVAVHQHLGVGPGVRLLDVACGSGLAIELASPAAPAAAASTPRTGWWRSRATARPRADVRVGDMHALPWDDDTFDAVTSFRGIWGTTPDAVAEVRGSCVPAAGWGSPSGATSRPRPAPGRSPSARDRREGRQPGGHGVPGPTRSR